MFTTLLESSAPKSRRVGGTLTSVLLHGSLIAGAVIATLDRSSGPRLAPEAITSLVLAPPASGQAQRTRALARPSGGPPVVPSVPLVVVDVSQVRIPEVSAGPTLGPDRFVIGLGVDDVGVGGSPIAGSGMGGDPVDERLVERSPRMVGRVPEPRFPAMLRAAGIEGRVLVQLVVDTLGRAEPDGVQIVEASHPLFAEAVREVLPRYRFTPGEVGGRKVRTRVQIPFAFTLRP